MLPRILLVAWLTLLLAACEMTSPSAAPGFGGATTSRGLEFRGERACVDCDGINTWLRLEADGKTQRYRMVEEYVRADRARRFEDEGEWIAMNELLRLRSHQGGERVYARLADGRLQAHGARGQPLPEAADDVMAPVSFDSTQ